MDTNYNLIKSEITYISETIKLFPEPLHEKVFDLLIAELISNRSLSATTSKHNTEIEESLDVNTSVSEHKIDEQPTTRHPGEALFEFIRENNEIIHNVTDLSFSTLIAYFYEVYAPAEEQRSEINGKILINAFEIANRKPPYKPSNPLNNAKKSKYLKQGSDRGFFSLTPKGRYYAKNLLLNEETNDEQ